MEGTFEGVFRWTTGFFRLDGKVGLLEMKEKECLCVVIMGIVLGEIVLGRIDPVSCGGKTSPRP